MREKQNYRIKSYGPSICLSIILSFSLLLFSSKNVQAASGSIYTCKMNPTYSHPVTGQVEDSGGSSSSTTGQGMVEGAIGSKGILEVTDSGEYYLTFQLGLMDYSSKQSFGVQNINDSGWNTVSATVTGNGSDSSGKTADMRIPVSSESCIVRCSMYVEPMGRNVIFYFYPSDYTEGNSTSMKAGIVTQNSSSSSGTADTQGSNAAANSSSSSSESTDAQGNNSAAQSQSATSTSNSGNSNGAGLSGTDSSNSSSSSGLTSGSYGLTTENNEMGNSSSTEDSLKDTQGLSLSTASDTNPSESDGSSSIGIVEIILAVCAGVTISGLILLFTGAYIVYIFRKNWKRWGAGKLYLTPEEQDYKEENVYMADGFGEPDTDDGVWDSEGVVHEEFWTEPGVKLSADSEGALDAKSNAHLNNEEERFFEECQEKESKKSIWDFEEESSFTKGYDEIGNSAELEGEGKYEN
nr:heme-binding Shp domain-containing protein [uncultured Anaerobutyricum sp.]